MPDNKFSPTRLRLPDATPPNATVGRLTRARLKGKFLAGPIPLDWILAAMALPGRALDAGVIIWFEYGCTKRRTVKLPLSRLTHVGIKEGAARRGLRSLAKAGLISIEHAPGRGLQVTLLDAP